MKKIYLWTVVAIFSLFCCSTLFSDVGESITPAYQMDTVNPTVSVSSPDGGEVLYYNQQVSIGWLAGDNNFGTNPITIDWSTDNGSSFSNLALNQSNAGSYVWSVPSVETSQARIKVTAVDSFGNQGSDISNNSFTLFGPSTMLTGVFSMDTVNPTAILTSPVGGETWYYGEYHPITWTAGDNHLITLPVKLEYKKANGAWSTLNSALENSGSFDWQIPGLSIPQSSVRLTVKDTFGNTTVDASDTPFAIVILPPKNPENVTMEIVNSRDAVITWSPVTQTILNTPIVPSAYLVLYNQTDDPDNEAAYYYLGENAEAVAYTHRNVARRAPHMYYRVLAVLDFDNNLREVLAGFRDNSKREIPVSWTELKAKLRERENSEKEK